MSQEKRPGLNKEMKRKTRAFDVDVCEIIDVGDAVRPDLAHQEVSQFVTHNLLSSPPLSSI